MGAEMRGGYANEIFTRNACSLVDDWCWRFEPEGHHKKMSDCDMMGIYDHTPESVRAADAAVPSAYAVACRCGFVDCRAGLRPVDEEDFTIARDFIRSAAEHGEGISGGY